MYFIERNPISRAKFSLKLLHWDGQGPKCVTEKCAHATKQNHLSYLFFTTISRGRCHIHYEPWQGFSLSLSISLMTFSNFTQEAKLLTITCCYFQFKECFVDRSLHEPCIYMVRHESNLFQTHLNWKLTRNLTKKWRLKEDE